MGAIKHPTATDVLNTPEAKSAILSFMTSSSSDIPSFSFTTSMISANKGTNINAIENPPTAYPTTINGMDCGK